ncbi:sensor histidine kinase [Flavobacterium sp. NRK F10]|uniref:tetratricopeptide repeat-containing sensor histidine kinase n=1 Tax=Flavobacterium sp. NRK F10 TaxID=2954931 RepID=UPI002090F6DA|nr:sensor histidine kinase [Flavobacterium sp. NRK F10]MCO6175410.1 sensor histidine kinase [Flavobacterium sp. NRK F10]
MRYLLLFVFLAFNFTIAQSDSLYKKSVSLLSRNRLDSARLFLSRAIKNNQDYSAKYDITYSKILKKIGKTDSSFYYLDVAEKKIYKSNIADSILLIYALKMEMTRHTHSKSLNHNILSNAEFFVKKNKSEIKNLEIFAYYLNRRMSCFNEFNGTNKDTIQIIFNTAEEILRLEPNLKNKEVVAYTLNEIAQVYEYRIDAKLGLEYYQRAHQYSKENNLISPFVDNSINYARYYLTKEGDYNSAIKVLKEAENVIDLNSDVFQTYRLYDFLMALFAMTNDFESAYSYQKKAHEKQLELERFKTSQYIKDLELKNIVEQNKSELKLNNEKLVNAENNQKLFLLVVLLVVIGLIVLGFYNRKINFKNKELDKLSTENEFLLSEANHRINNNLQLIIILISEELKKSEDANTSSFKKILSKVESISTLHRHLYKSENKREINIADYLTEIQSNFIELFIENNIKIDFKVESQQIDTNLAMYFGLMITELFINSIKHAFPDEQETKKITFNLNSQENQLHFFYSDNGKNSIGKTLYPKLVIKMCRQIKVNYTIDTINGFSFSFNKPI